jgi:hypothetical protein
MSQPQAIKKQWASLVHLTWWTIWKERNNRIFHNNAAPISRIHSNIIEEAELARRMQKKGS